jgi:hypothetical protein
MTVTIQNQCSVTEPLSPVYFSEGTTHYNVPGCNMKPDIMVRIQPMGDLDRCVFIDVLLHPLNRNVIYDNDAANNTYLLVV